MACTAASVAFAQNPNPLRGRLVCHPRNTLHLLLPRRGFSNSAPWHHSVFDPLRPPWSEKRRIGPFCRPLSRQNRAMSPLPLCAICMPGTPKRQGHQRAAPTHDDNALITERAAQRMPKPLAATRSIRVNGEASDAVLEMLQGQAGARVPMTPRPRWPDVASEHARPDALETNQNRRQR